jgi:hypothetical protein
MGCIKPKRLASLITIVDQGKVSNTVPFGILTFIFLPFSGDT